VNTEVEVADLSTVTQFVEATAYAVVVGAVPVLAAWLKQHLAFLRNAAAQSAAGDAIDRVEALSEKGAAAGYAWAQAHSVSIEHPAIANAVLEQGVTFVAQFGADALKESGYTPEQVAKLVSAGLGKLLAADPNVSIASPVAPVPAIPQTPAYPAPCQAASPAAAAAEQSIAQGVAA
jgi:hypothetical protein